MKIRIIVCALCVAAALAWVISFSPNKVEGSSLQFRAAIGAQVDNECMVQLKPSLLGVSGETAISPLDESGKTTVAGKLAAVSDDWFVLRDKAAGRIYWIPRENILLLEFDD